MRLRRHLALAASLTCLMTTLAAGAVVAPTVSAEPASGTSTAQVADPMARDRPLSVMSFNIHHGVGPDSRLDLQRIADVIKSENLDVVGLQEVDRHWSERSNFVDQASWLARELGMHVVYGANLDLDPLAAGEPRRQFGTAILSRHRVREWSNTFLPRFEGHEQRGLLKARINVRGIWVQVFNTHLQHNDAAERLEQTTAVKSLIGTPNESVVLLGDLNAVPTAPEIDVLVDDLVDTWEAAGLGDGETFPSEDPNVRIDYVLTSADVVARAAAVVTTDASDHLPVRADIVIPGNRVGLGRG